MFASPVPGLRTKIEYQYREMRVFFFYTHSDRGVCVENSDIMRLSHCAIHSLRDEQDSAEAKQATLCMLVKEVRI